jgi:hypothetical protein
MIGPGETDSGIYGLILVRQAFGTLGIFLSDAEIRKKSACVLDKAFLINKLRGDQDAVLTPRQGNFDASEDAAGAERQSPLAR